MHTDLVRPSPLVHSLSPPSLHVRVRHWPQHVQLWPRRVRHNWRSKASTKTQALLGMMSPLLYATIVLSVLEFVTLVLCILLARRLRQQGSRIDSIAVERENYELDEATSTKSESNLLSRPILPDLGNLGHLSRFLRRIGPQRLRHFHIALMASEAWLSDMNLYPGNIHIVVDGEGYEYSLHVNCWVNIEDKSGKLVPLTPEVCGDKNERRVWAVMPFQNKPIARIHGMVIVNGAPLEHDMLSLFNKLPISMATCSGSQRGWVSVRMDIQRERKKKIAAYFSRSMWLRKGSEPPRSDGNIS